MQYFEHGVVSISIDSVENIDYVESKVLGLCVHPQYRRCSPSYDPPIYSRVQRAIMPE